MCILVPEQYRCIWLVTTSTHTGALAPLPEPATQEAHAYTDGASTGSRGSGGYGVIISWKDKTEEISGGEQDTTNLRMEVTAACVALETIDEGHARRHREVRWRKVKGHSKSGGAHKSGNDRADELAVAAKKEASGERTSGPTPRDIGLPY